MAHDRSEFFNTDLANIYEILEGISGGGTLPAGAATSALQGTQQTTLLNQLSKLGDLDNVLALIKVDSGNSLINLNELNLRLQSLIQDRYSSLIQIATRDNLASMADVKNWVDAWLVANPAVAVISIKPLVFFDGASEKYSVMIYFR